MTRPLTNETPPSPPARIPLPRLLVRIHTDAGTLDISAPVTGLSIEPPYMVASTIGDEPHLCQPISHHVSVHWTPHRPGEAKAAHSYEDARACGMALTTTGPIME